MRGVETIGAGTRTMVSRLLIAMAIAAVGLLGIAEAATAAPALRLDGTSDTNAVLGKKHFLALQIRNLGDDPTSGPAVLKVSLPDGMGVAEKEDSNGNKFGPYVIGFGFDCSGVPLGAQSFQCTSPNYELAKNGQGLLLHLQVEVAADAPPGLRTVRYEVSGAGTGTAATGDPVRFAPSPPPFGLEALDVQFLDEAGGLYTQAGGHPHSYTTFIDLNVGQDPNPAFPEPAFEGLYPIEPPRNVVARLPAGMIGNPTTTATCTLNELAGPGGQPLCSPESQVGLAWLKFNLGGSNLAVRALFNMAAPNGRAARLGFNVLGTTVALDATLKYDGEYALEVASHNISQGLPLAAAHTEIWGVPGDKSHLDQRSCAGRETPLGGGPSCEVKTEEPGATPVAFLRMPTSCTAPGEGLLTKVRASSWHTPGAVVSGSVETHELPGYPYSPEDPTTPWGEKRGTEGCDAVEVAGELAMTPTTPQAESPSGFDVRLAIPNPGLEDPDGISSSDLKKVKVTLPEGMTVNPSQAVGLNSCSPAEYSSTELTLTDVKGGCPSDSKIGTVDVRTPLLEERLPGEVFIAKPYENPFGTLLALYVVIAEPKRGILIKMDGKVETDPATGRITTTFDDLPEQPFTTYDFRLRTGPRAPLVNPPACGKYTIEAELTGHSDPNGAPLKRSTSFNVTEGVAGAPCPSGAPFNPALSAGTMNPIGGAYSPFSLRLTRSDSEQQLSSFSIKMPPGLTGKLAGIQYCPEAAIAAAKDPNRTGAQELAQPSCPAASQVGRTLVGSGTGPILAQVPGSVYLAGPYNGAPLSLVSITPAKVGPFDLGTVVVRLALRINPETAEVFADATGSEPLPLFIDGVATKLRDVRAYVDRPGFTLNPTNCNPSAVVSNVVGSGLSVPNPADDFLTTVSSRFQVANCADLGFKPKLRINLSGGTKRSDNPALRAELRMPSGNANIARAQVTLPKTSLLDQSHIRTICTRVQYAADACPKGSVYGYAKAWSPLLDAPLEGPVYLRSSSNKLPDLVAGLKGQIEVDLVGRIDSVNARIRTTFDSVPDAPVTKFVLNMRGGRKSLLVNNTDLCKAKPRATVLFDAHNGKTKDLNPLVKAKCGKAKKGKGKARK